MGSVVILIVDMPNSIDILFVIVTDKSCHNLIISVITLKIMIDFKTKINIVFHNLFCMMS